MYTCSTHLSHQYQYCSTLVASVHRPINIHRSAPGALCSNASKSKVARSRWMNARSRCMMRILCDAMPTPNPPYTDSSKDIHPVLMLSDKRKSTRYSCQSYFNEPSTDNSHGYDARRSHEQIQSPNPLLRSRNMPRPNIRIAHDAPRARQRPQRAEMPQHLP